MAARWSQANPIVKDPDIHLGLFHRVLLRTDGQWCVIDKRRHFADQTVFVSRDSPQAISKCEELSGEKYKPRGTIQ